MAHGADEVPADAVGGDVGLGELTGGREDGADGVDGSSGGGGIGLADWGGLVGL